MTAVIPIVVVRELVAFGATGEALLAACERIAAGLGTLPGEATHRVTIGQGAASPSAELSPSMSPLRPRAGQGDMPAIGPVTDPNKHVAIARRALSLDDTLGKSARRVGALLLDHYNRTTGRCDPGMARIAGALGLSRRTVIRALAELDRRGLVLVGRHGGHQHCNAYGFAWDRFAALAGGADGAVAEGVTSIKRDNRWREVVTPHVTQTLNQNPLRESGVVVSQRAKPQRPPDPRQRQMLFSIAGGGKAGIAEDVAHARLWREFCKRFAGEQWAFEAFGQQEPLVAQATSAEQARPGSGLGLLEQLFVTHGVGPPRRANG